MKYASKVLRARDNTLPLPLKEVNPPPEKLYIRGAIPENRHMIAIVGSRKFTPYGKMITESLVEYLKDFDVCIVSGLALGIDAIAHRAALTNNVPTVGFLPGGIEKVYPASHRKLAEEIIEKGGALLSEYPAATGAFKSHFHERNRLISGLSDIVVVIEAGERSGTLITARCALEQGKELIAAPGPIHSPSSKGTNTLIKSGAHILTEPRDVTDVLGLKPRHIEKKNYTYDSDAEKQIHELLIGDDLSGDEIMRKLQLERSRYLQTITMLELKGYVHPLGADRWSGR